MSTLESQQFANMFPKGLRLADLILIGNSIAVPSTTLGTISVFSPLNTVVDALKVKSLDLAIASFSITSTDKIAVLLYWNEHLDKSIASGFPQYVLDVVSNLTVISISSLAPIVCVFVALFTVEPSSFFTV